MRNRSCNVTGTPKLTLCAIFFLTVLSHGCVHETIAKPKSPLPENKVAVVGEVMREGLVDFREGMTVLSAIKASGGVTQAAQADRTTLTRSSGGLAATVSVHLNAIVEKRELDMPLEPGDIIHVPGPEPAIEQSTEPSAP